MLEHLSIKKAIELAVNTEKMGAEFYGKLEAKYADDAQLKDVFGRLKEDEKIHEAQFAAILKDVKEDSSASTDDESYHYLAATAFSRFFKDGALDDVSDVADAMARALSFEKSTLQYYQALRDVMGKSEPLDRIIDAERKHVVALMKVIVTDAKFRGLQDRW